jgi:hypothetical protein
MWLLQGRFGDAPGSRSTRLIKAMLDYTSARRHASPRRVDDWPDRG